MNSRLVHHRARAADSPQSSASGHGAGPRIALAIASFSSELRASRVTLTEVLDYAADAGFEEIELCDRTVPEDKAQRSDLMEQLSARGLRLCCIDIRNDFTLADPDARREQVRHVKAWIGIARELQVPLCRVWIGQTRDDDEAFMWAASALREVAVTAAAENVVLAIETHGGISSDSVRLLKILDWVSSPFVQACVDFGWLAAENRCGDIRRLLPVTVHVHAKSHAIDGSGRDPDIDFEEIGKVFLHHDYSGLYSVEYEGVEHAFDRGPKIRGVVRLLDRFFSLQTSAAA